MTTSTWQFTIPVVAVCLLVESYYALKEDKALYSTRDTFCSIILGLTAFVSNLICKIAVLHGYALIYQYRIMDLPDSFSIYLLALLCCDFSFYWYHRAAHEVNWFWISHAVHHSSHHYNISTALRQPWSAQLTGQSLFWAWMPLAGFQPVLVIFTCQLVIFYQFWLHTETIRKIPGVLEFLFNTPSHHRVHHGSNVDYLDKNHGGIFIIWDRMFGTFQAETETPVFGLAGKEVTYDPIAIAFSGWKEALARGAKSNSFGIAIRYLIKAPGWSHDGTSKTVRQLRKELRQMKNSLSIMHSHAVPNRLHQAHPKQHIEPV